MAWRRGSALDPTGGSPRTGERTPPDRTPDSEGRIGWRSTHAAGVLLRSSGAACEPGRPLVLVAVRWHHGTLLLVRRCDSGARGLPVGRVDVGETAAREPAEEAGVHVEATESAGLFTDPGTWCA